MGSGHCSTASHILTDLQNELLEEVMLLRSHYKQNNAFQSSNTSNVTLFQFNFNSTPSWTVSIR